MLDHSCYIATWCKKMMEKSLVTLWPWLLLLKHPVQALGLEKELSHKLLLNHHPPGQGQFLINLHARVHIEEGI